MENIIVIYFSTIVLIIVLVAELIILSQKSHYKNEKDRKEIKKAVKN